MYSAIDAELRGRNSLLTCFSQACACLQGLVIANSLCAAVRWVPSTGAHGLLWRGGPSPRTVLVV